jgi:hypothetical protein
MRTAAAVVLLMAGLAGALGFHFVRIAGSTSQRLCVVPKERLSFEATFVSASSEITFALAHPVIASRILAGKGWCSGR